VIKIEIDPGHVFQREFTALEQKNLPFALQQTVNRTADEIKRAWENTAQRVFDRPVQMTRRAVMVKKARYTRNASGARKIEAAQVYIRDEAHKGTPPAKYLLAQVYGGTRRATGLEAGLQRIGVLTGNDRTVLGKGASTDGSGNIRSGVVKQILSQLHAQRDSYANESDVSRARRRKRYARQGIRGGEYFVVRGRGQRGYTMNRDGSARRSSLHPGIYQRFSSGFGSGVRSVFVFVNGATYRPRYDIFKMAQREWNRLIPLFFDRELKKAVETSMFRGRR